MDTGVLDEALEALSNRAPDLANGNTNHAPMVAETLVRMGRPESVLAWVDGYRRDLPERPGERPALSGDWREALGRSNLWPEWVAFFRRELDEAPWQQVLDTWSARLAPGLSGEATHGLIRTAHAARALGAAQTAPRLMELADGLAYWAAGYHVFPEAGATSLGYSIDEAMARVPLLSPDRSGNIDATLRRLDAMPEVAPLVGLLEPGDDPLVDLSALARRFAGVYLRNAHDPRRTFAVLHAVTGPASVRLLAPYVSIDSARLLLRYGWQIAAAIYAVYAPDREPVSLDESFADGKDDLIDAAVSSGAAHAIKFVEACLREQEVAPHAVFLAAAADAARRLEG